MKIDLVSFATEAEFRSWLDRHHARKTEVWLRLRRTKAAGPGIIYAQALDLALCFGWIDGVRQAADARSYLVRFTPRRSTSIWSLVNLRHFERLEKLGLVAAPGRAAHARRDPKRSGLYSFETPPREFSPAQLKKFRSEPRAWEHFQSQPPGYRRVATFWVVSAKQEATRERRLAQLIADSAAGRRLRQLA